MGECYSLDSFSAKGNYGIDPKPVIEERRMKHSTSTGFIGIRFDDHESLQCAVC